MRTGVYIHIPFCLRKCLYCDFISFEKDNFREYTDGLKKEIKLYHEILSGCDIDSIFIGGGTPSVIHYSYIGEILDMLNPAEGCEITIEVNPGTVSLEQLKAYKDMGINRISIGMQSANDNELKALGRIHNNRDFLKVYNDIRKAGFENVNLDIMFGIPEQREESFKKTLDQVFSLNPEHISAYSLIIEEGTPFYNMQLRLPGEDAERNMYAAVLNNNFGYERYEISNFCHKGYECKHNLKYWRFEPFLGFGVGAYSFFNGIRYNNQSKMEEYLNDVNNGRKPVAFCEKETKGELIKDYIITAMRLSEGIIYSDFKNKFGISFEEKYKEIIEKYSKNGYIQKNSNRICFSDKGFEVSNYILKDFI